MKIKRTVTLSTAVPLMLVLSACGGAGSGDHRGVAQDALNAVADGDVEGLCELFADSETGPATDIQKSQCQETFTYYLADLSQADLDAIGDLTVTTVTLTQADENRVQVEVDDYEEADGAVTPTMDLQKFEDRWYVTDLTI